MLHSSLSATFDAWLVAAGSVPALQAVAIVAGTFVLEDATTIIVAILVADGKISMPVALAGLYAGVILGDLGLYGLGRLASRHGRAGRLARHRRLAPFRAWLDARLILMVFVVRFIPGLRLPTYTASGFFRLPFSRFAFSVIAATTLWTTGLFFASWWFGALTAHSVGIWRWGVGLGLAVVLFLAGRYNAKKFLPESEISDDEDGPEDDADTADTADTDDASQSAERDRDDL